jgi:streptogramin lyase
MHTLALNRGFHIARLVALLAGCGGSQPPIGAPGAMPQTAAISTQADRGKSWMLPEAKSDSDKPWLYVSDTTGNAVYIYALKGSHASQIGEITNEIDVPFAATVDSSGNLYVVNRSSQGSVTIYPPGETSPSLTLSKDLTYPEGVAVDASGNVWVTNRGSTPGIAVFPPGSTTPSAYITGNLIRYPLEDFFDQHGNLYFADAETGVSKIPSGSQHPVSLGLLGLHSAVGVALAPSGSLYVNNYTPNKGKVYTTLAYALGNNQPKYKLQGHVAAYSIAVGNIGSKNYVFIPDWYSGQVSVYRDGSRKPFAQFETLSANTGGVAFKPAGVP